MSAMDFLQASKNERQIAVQPYDRTTCQASVVHLGVGAFHRAHQAVYFDRLMALDEGKTWGITGVNIRPNDSQFFAKLMQQKGEYLLKTMSPDGKTKYEHIRSILNLIDGAKTPFDVDHLIANPETQLITCTVTEGGYYLDESQQLMLEHGDISGDLQGERNTLYAFLYAGLKARMEQQSGPITLLCCDNLRHNGQLLRKGLLQFVEQKGDAQLSSWLVNNASFPCSMVDRITPKPDAKHVTETQAYFAVNDEMTVMAEDYIQWVVEDDFAGKRPALERVGAELVQDVIPYEEAKIRILNAGHTCVTYQAALKGYTYFDEAMMDTELESYFTQFTQTEAISALGNSIVDLGPYSEVIKQRFKNSNIGDTVARICSDGYAKFPIFVLPTLKGMYQLGKVPTASLQALASWFVFFQHSNMGKLGFDYHEPSLSAMSAFTNDEAGMKAFVGNRSLWGDLLDHATTFEQDLISAIEEMLRRYPL